ncbi:hypothetical protein EUTSA_v10010891mg [Eutrema salsugineum]|uniref:Uncharacterized protein n=1 Tax=Eutrema salsugineum TaxID=72664 RepID=V4NIA3_EUTSA|nr:hypothetical protein EUTSA_v10010891mg [Eutrema salsugineum]
MSTPIHRRHLQLGKLATLIDFDEALTNPGLSDHCGLFPRDFCT